jgi:beta-glucanase (GH16 family)
MAIAAKASALTFDDELTSFQVWNGSSGWDPFGGPQWSDLPTNRVIPSGTLAFNNELQWYVNPSYVSSPMQPNPFSVSNGVLGISAVHADISNDFDHYDYASGIITSHDWHQQLYGYFEIRAQLPAGTGLLPAFWLLPADGSQHGEIDIMEVLGSDPSTLYTTVHSFSTGSLVSTTSTTAVLDTSAGFHTYGVDWEANFITW